MLGKRHILFILRKRGMEEWRATKSRNTGRLGADLKTVLLERLSDPGCHLGRGAPALSALYCCPQSVTDARSHGPIQQHATSAFSWSSIVTIPIPRSQWPPPWRRHRANLMPGCATWGDAVAFTRSIEGDGDAINESNFVRAGIVRVSTHGASRPAGARGAPQLRVRSRFVPSCRRGRLGAGGLQPAAHHRRPHLCGIRRYG